MINLFLIRLGHYDKSQMSWKLIRWWKLNNSGVFINLLLFFIDIAQTVNYIPTLMR